jgi:selenocysteine lyase/cysteine desulfurase
VNTDTPTKKEDVFANLERGVLVALENYSNVHRGSGFKSQASTILYEKSREIVLEYLGLDKQKYTVVFCSPGRAGKFIPTLNPGMYQVLSSEDVGLSIGVRAIAIRKNALPAGTPVHTGGGSARLVSPEWVVWALTPDKFEAGTPAIINVIAFARALKLIGIYGQDAFRSLPSFDVTAESILYDDECESLSGKELLLKLSKDLIGNDIKIPSASGEIRYINLDNGASTPALRPAWDAFRRSIRLPENTRNNIIENVKSIIAGFLGFKSDKYDIFFTSNTTESINFAAANFARTNYAGLTPVIISTILEHTSDDLPWRNIPGAEIIRLTVDDEGFIDTDELKRLFREYNTSNIFGRKSIRMVAISGSSNVLGSCNNISEISKIAHDFGAHLLVDAAQLVGHRKINLEECNPDYLCFSGHKVYAPFGSGVLIARKGLMETDNTEILNILSSGLENVAGIAALGKALLLMQRIGMDVVMQEEQILTAKALKDMSRIQGLQVYGVANAESPVFQEKSGVIVFSIKGVWPDKVARNLAKAGIGVRYGCHCAHILIKHILHVPLALQRLQKIMVTFFPKMVLPGVVRISFGIGNSKEDIDYLISELKHIDPKNQENTDFKKRTESMIRDVVDRTFEK